MKFREYLNETIPRGGRKTNFNARMDTIGDFVPKNDEDFFAAVNSAIQDNHTASLDTLVSRFGEGMLDYYKNDR